jgi:glycosyltransferase involved in cell wall biosynthesis
VDGGIGGSEEAVVFLSRELAAQGWQVVVYAFPPPNETGLDAHGVYWTQYSAWDESRPWDVYVGWRQFRGIDPRGSKAKQRWLWMHDLVVPEYFSEEMVATWDGIFCLTEWHASKLPPFARSKAVLTKNGINPDYLVDGPNRAMSIIYASSPDRGLEQLLDEWPKIAAALPKATLDIYYGFTPQYLADETRVPGLRATRLKVEAAVQRLPRVFWHGMVGQMELAHAFARSGFWAYPTSWPETSCITAMKAQAMGCIPVTSRYKDSGVPETTQFDLGPAARDGMIRDNPEWMSEWTEALLSAARRSDLDTMRKEMKTWARAAFNWRKVAEQWVGLWKVRSSARSPSPARTQPQPAEVS